ncbi:MAG: glycosyltransferase family 39 protein [Clostridia bacterium]|nr:glycosyltransferase family 39 protein [Clostridia bacterium]
MKTEKIIAFIKRNKFILIIMLLLFIERFAALYELGIYYSLNSDDVSYVKSGIIFANNGTITILDHITAQIMPGMTVFIGLLSLIFGEGKLLWLVLKLVWIATGSLTAWFIYKSVNLFAPKWCGLLATLPLFRPDFVWMDNLILTETPFILFFTAMIYFTLKMGKENNYKNFWGCAIFYMLALMLKANIAPYPVFALIYLLVLKYDRKLLVKQIAILAAVVLCFVVPWSIRNYVHFKAFIPLTYGAGNPTLLGTYQGINYPKDSELDYETNVDQKVKEKYEKYYDENGNPEARYRKYISLKTDEIKAEYRQKVWREKDIKSYLYSYLILKPRDMINSIFYWKTAFNIGAEKLVNFPIIEILLCFFITAASLILKKCRAPVIFALLTYIGNIYIYATTFSFSRYGVSIATAKFIIIGIGIYLFVHLISRAIKSVQKYDLKSQFEVVPESEEIKIEKF